MGMTQEDKDLLLKYLCMALPYGVKILHNGWSYEWDDELSTVERVVGIDENFIYTKVIDTHNGEEYREDEHTIDTFDDKPYLRIMSSMTEKEEKDFHAQIYKAKPYSDGKSYNIYEVIGLNIDWLLKNHFDFIGLIPKGLAIEVNESNNPYKE